MNLPIALQLYSLRNEMEADLEGTLSKVKEMGYEGAELAGLYGNSPAYMKEVMARYEITPVSAHVPFVDMMADPEQILKDYQEIGCQYIAIPYLTEEYRPGAEKFQEVIDGAKMIGEMAKKYNLTLLYHNHDFEFQKINGAYALDVLYDTVPADLLQTELDTCWVNVGGENPVSYIGKYAGRTPVVHLKDFVNPDNSEGAKYQLIGIKEEEEASEGFAFMPLGQGVQDIPAIVKAAETAGAHWVVVEQDEPTKGMTPFECAKASIEFLKMHA